MTTSPRAQLPPVPPSIPTLSTAQGRMLNQRLPMAAITPQNCITCRGQKWFLWRDPQGNPVEYDCDCNGQFMLFRYFAYSGVPLNYQRLGWADFSYLSDDAARIALDYLDNIDRYLSAGFGLVIHGTKGNGKTLLGYLIAKRLLAEGNPCYSTTFAEMLSNFMGTFRNPDQEKWFNQKVRNAGVLFIDDLGREYVTDRFAQDNEKTRPDNRPGSVRESMLEAVIRHRTANCQPTIITTNFTPQQVLDGYGGHTLSLLAEKAIYIEVVGQDRRQEMNDRERHLILDGLTRPVVVE